MKSIKLKLTVIVSIIMIAALLSQGVTSIYLTKKETEQQIRNNITLVAHQTSEILVDMERNTLILESKMMEGYDNELKSQMDTIFSILNYYEGQSSQGLITEQEAQNLALESIRNIRYGENGYFWIDDSEYNMILHPITPENEGVNRENLTDQTGNKFIKEMVDRATKGEETFVNYFFPKPGDQSKAYPKRSHNRYFEPWQWIPGTGNYIDDIEDEIASITEQLNENFQQKIIEIGENGAAGVLDTEGNFLFSSSPEYIGQKIELTDANTGEDIIEKILNTDNDFIEYSIQDPESGNIQSMVAFVDYEEETNKHLFVARDKEIVLASVTELTNILIVLILGVIFITIIAVFWIAKVISNPIIQIEKAANQIASGDLTRDEIKIKSKDEVGKLAEAFNKMSTNLRQLIVQVSTNAEQVAASSEQLMASAEQTSQSSQQIASSIQQVSGGAENQVTSTEESVRSLEEIATGIQRISENASVVSDVTIDTTKQAEEGGQFVRKTVGQMNSINQSVDQSDQAIKLLNDRSQEVGKILEVITDIAEQTNLLALNAAIEAARAGEHGRGFAIVADEVRKLAEQSGVSANQISDLIKEIQRDTFHSVSTMEKVKKEVHEGREVVNQTEQKFNQIITSMQQVSDQIQDISATAQQLSAGSEQVTAAVTEVSQITRESSDSIYKVATAANEQQASMEEISNSATSLSKLAEDLNSLVSKFKI